MDTVKEEIEIRAYKRPVGRSGVATVGYDCEWCGKEHFHGWPDNERRGGRVSHCPHPNAPQAVMLVLDDDGEG